MLKQLCSTCLPCHLLAPLLYGLPRISQFIVDTAVLATAARGSIVDAMRPAHVLLLAVLLPLPIAGQRCSIDIPAPSKQPAPECLGFPPLIASCPFVVNTHPSIKRREACPRGSPLPIASGRAAVYAAQGPVHRQRSPGVLLPSTGAAPVCNADLIQLDRRPSSS
jgi:hypothetical protein